MKTIITTLSLLMGAVFLSSCASVDEASLQPARLYVSVDVPASMDPIRQDYVAEEFGHRVASALRDQGLPGPIRYVSELDEPVAGVPRLAVSLREWRVDRIGNVDCTFHATLHTPGGNQSLGLFTGTSMLTWTRRDWMARADGFEDAASDALGNLGRRIIETGLLPDMPLHRY